MRYWYVALFLLSSGCVSQVKLSVNDTAVSRSSEMQQEIDAILAADTENKRWERIYLKEIAIAQENNDPDAYKFFITEYIKMPRMKLPEWMKQEPNYTQPVSEIDILRGQIRIQIIKQERE